MCGSLVQGTTKNGKWDKISREIDRLALGFVAIGPDELRREWVTLRLSWANRDPDHERGQRDGGLKRQL